MYLAKAALCIIILIVDGVGVAELVVVKAIDAPIVIPRIPRVCPRGRRVQVLVSPVVVIVMIRGLYLENGNRDQNLV